MRRVRVLLLIVITLTIGLTVVILRGSDRSGSHLHIGSHDFRFEHRWPRRPSTNLASWLSPHQIQQPPAGKEASASGVPAHEEPVRRGYELDPRFHPIRQLTALAQRQHEETLSSQSRGLRGAVDEYRRRYGIPPPPNFDRWYEYATKRNVVLIDEYDSIQHSLIPFWALKPKVIRDRTKEALGFDNALLGLSIRDGKAVRIDGPNGYEWQMEATMGMIEGFVQYLPDMDIAFNIHDEPRVILSHDSLAEHVQLALKEALPAAAANLRPERRWSPRPADLNDGSTFSQVHITRFNRFSHQPTWTNSRLSCPPSSAARSLTTDDHPADDTELYATPGDIGFLYNHTAFTDICSTPSFEKRFGFFDRPNAFCVVHDLFPIFSQSKVSSFQDILYPSPWYWAGKVTYDPEKDFNWDEKENSMYWRGSTTGGFSRDGGWRRQHRQRFMRILHGNDNASILVPPVKSRKKTKPASNAAFVPVSIPRADLSHLFNVSFSLVSQCDPPDCEEQIAFFTPTPEAPFQSAWKYKHLLDLDGNAFSGRFYAFLKSHSLTYKMAVFREWHDDWIAPWVHYVPLGLEGTEWVEAVRWLSGGGDEALQKKVADEKAAAALAMAASAAESMKPARVKRSIGRWDEEEGEKVAREIAARSTEWHDMVLRKEDLETWFFRLLLEYGRLVDDNREKIGYSI